MSPDRPNEAGFTLLEILVAITITAMLVTATVTGTRQLHSAFERAVQDYDRTRTARILLDRLERELVGTMLVVREVEGDEDTRDEHPWLFIGDDRVFDSNDSDAVRFVTRSPARAPGAQESGLRMVTYAVENLEGDRYDLVRQEQELPAALDKDLNTFDAEPVVEDVFRFSLRYQDDEDGEWKETWDSTDVAQLDRLPNAVELAVQLVELHPDGEWVAGQEQTRLVKLPVRPIVPGPPEEGAADDGACEGVTLNECFVLFQDELNADQTVTELLTQFGEQCVSDLDSGDTLPTLFGSLYEAAIEECTTGPQP